MSTHHEKLQRLLDQYIRGLMTPEEYRDFTAQEIRVELFKRDMARKYGR